MADVDDAAVERMLRRLAERLEAHKDHLCALDSAVGDGDHGVSMTIAMRALTRNLDELDSPSAAEALRAVSEAFADEVGAAIGPILEDMFEAAARTLEDGRDLASSATWAAVFEAMAGAAHDTGGARPGDKTLLDAWIPAAAAMRSGADANATLPVCLARASEAAWQGVEATIDLVPRLGRASRLGERARGHPDPGATSAAIMIDVMRDELADPGGTSSST